MWWFKRNKHEHNSAKEETGHGKNEKEPEYTNIVTTSGRRLKKVKGGWSLMGIGSDYNESGFRSV